MIEEFNSKHFNLEKVSPSVYAAIAKEGGGSAANAGFVDLGDKVMVFDTFNTQQASEDLRYIAEKVTKQPITWVINSHWHGDHIRGNQTFNDRNIISSEITYSKMKEIHPSRISKQKNDLQGLSDYIESLSKKNDPALQDQIHFLRELERSLPTLKLTLPHQTYSGELTFFGTTCSAKLFSLGGGHSICDTILYIPEEKVIFMGDLLFVRCHPTFFEESNPDKWVEILRKVVDFDFEAAIPGHGSVGGKDDVIQLILYINELQDAVRECGSIEEIDIPEKYRDWKSPDVFYQNIKLLNHAQNGLSD
ncbi:Second ring cyclase [[Bacillus] enclensis]|uniref:Glyoxylase, beta-lactamase superfamily II n=1 Tax=[Bacillus] enclensis TaxID=1402860 RepID=A0A0V8HPM7_9BACI|nr:MBL fold metallo-hydrolase [[Bacillus] enclensis]KSU64557.1 Second ring cyclase [[Bacillus] enclensis]SCB76108.1 Glyoxylase, beta-lactamase superfamily II [[Bacillus] enclensis]